VVEDTTAMGGGVQVAALALASARFF
jgi:hypothetical protein